MQAMQAVDGSSTEDVRSINTDIHCRNICAKKQDAAGRQTPHQHCSSNATSALLIYQVLQEEIKQSLEVGR